MSASFAIGDLVDVRIADGNVEDTWVPGVVVQSAYDGVDPLVWEVSFLYGGRAERRFVSEMDLRPNQLRAPSIVDPFADRMRAKRAGAV